MYTLLYLSSLVFLLFLCSVIVILQFKYKMLYNSDNISTEKKFFSRKQTEFRLLVEG